MKKKNIYNKNIILFGCGAVQRCNMHFLDKYFVVDPEKMLFVDLVDNSHYPDVKKYLDLGAKYAITDINKTYKTIINNLNKFDIILDLTDYTDSLGISKYCLEKDIHYINTSLEETVEQIKQKKDFNETYQYMHNFINTMRTEHKTNATQALCAGMNPGLITIFASHAIYELAKNKKSIDIKVYKKNNDFANVCKFLGVELILCSETDTAEFNKKNIKQKFYNTWCCNAFLAENGENAQITWGTHENNLPNDKSTLISDHVLNIKEKANDIYLKSIVPNEKFIGVCIPHSENIYSADAFSTDDYSPSIYYVYKYSPVCYQSLKKYNKIVNKEIPKLNKNDTHVLNNYDDDFEGIDKVGALVVTKNKNAIWCGSILSNNDECIGTHSATTAQVSIGIMAFLHYILDNPNKGAIFPHEIDHEYILKLIKPYIGFTCEKINYDLSTQFNELRTNKKNFDAQYKK